MSLSSRKVDLPLILYGNGKLGKLAKEIFDKLKIPIQDIFSKDIIPKKHNKGSLIAVCIAVSPFKPIHNLLVAQGYESKNIVSVYDIFLAYPEMGILSGWLTGETLAEEQMNIYFVTQHYHDKESRIHYRAFFCWHKRYEEPIGRIFPLIINTENRWYIPEVQAALTDKDLIYKEIPGSTLADIERRRKSNPIFKEYPLSGSFGYIQLHLEGRELENIKTNMGYFQRNRPILGVTCYHTRDGLWRIERELMDGLENYNFYFRLHSFQGQSAILYGIPVERNIKK